MENEKLFLDAARTSGLTLPPDELVTDSNGSAGLLVQGRPPADKVSAAKPAIGRLDRLRSAE